MLSQTVRESIGNLWAAKQRSLLALLGIIIGTGSVIAMANIGAIAEKHAIAQIISTGIDMIVVNIERETGSSPANVTPEDIRKLVAEVPELAAAVPIVTGGKRILYRGQHVYGSTLASDPQLFDLMDLKVDSGRLLSRFDGLAMFCVIGDHAVSNQVADRRTNGKLGDTTKAKIGDVIRIGSESFSIVGILDRKAQSPMLPVEIGSSIFVTYSNAGRISDNPRIGAIVGRMAPGVTAEATTTNVKRFFGKRFPDAPIRIQTATQMIEEMREQVRTYSLLLGAIGGISLIVGGVGVMNVMLVSVTERRLEIGIRMAIGARRRDIKLMFLIESLVLSLVGGIIGTLIGVGSSAIFAGVLDWSFTLAGYAIPLGVGVAMAVGVFFGIYPAAAAARMNPVDALRSE